MDWQLIETANWQLIETAPKDETEILTYSGGVYRIARYCADTYAKKSRPYWTWHSGSVVHERANQPTHWMLLPKPPVLK